MPRILSLLLFLTTLGLVQPAQCAGGPYAVYRSSAQFLDVMRALQMAIEERGLYVNTIMHMGDMLARTGKDLGMDRPLFLQAETVQFCSALLSRRMTEENPARIVNCPYLISVYVLPTEPDVTYIAHRRLDQDDPGPVMDEVEAMLEGLAKAAAEGF